MAEPSLATRSMVSSSAAAADVGVAPPSWAPTASAPEAAPAAAPRRGQRDYALRRLLAGGDLAAVAIAFLTAIATRPGQPDLAGHLLWALLILPAWLILFKLYGLYDRDVKRISHTTVDDIPSLLHAVVIGGLLTWLYFHAAPVSELIFGEILTFGVLAIILILGLRSGLRGAMARLGSPERVLLVGESESTSALVRKMRTHPEYALQPVGVLLPDPTRPGPGCLPVDSLPVLGGVEELGAVVERHAIERIVVSPDDIDQLHVMELLYRCKELSRKVSILPSISDAMGPSTEVDDLEGVTVLGINPPALGRSSRLMKRTLDVAGAGVTLLLLAPLALLVALAIKLDSPGPVFFRQRRVGMRGQRFQLVKFRTMVTDAEKLREELAAQSTDPHWLKLESDPRITRVGRFLRLTSLDELPQLWNVLRGEMSLVGPRPLIESEDELVRGWARGRLDLTPGITGYWQVLGRTIIPFAEMVKLDYLYVTNWSLWTDIRLILRTLPVVLSRRGAN